MIFNAGADAKIKANIAAIKLSDLLKKQNRPATADEKKILAQYIGWGQFAQKVFPIEVDAFLRKHPDGANPQDHFTPYSTFTIAQYEAWLDKYGRFLHPAVGGVLTLDQWKSALESVRNAHFTDPAIARSMWDLVRHLGFNGGLAVEPSAGSGIFLGTAPQDLAIRWEAVEKDQITGQILGQLYPAARVQVTGTETARGLPVADADLVIGNFPFGRAKVYDADRPLYSSWSIHNYFFGRSLDMVRPGGLVVAITSHYSLDALSGGKIREALGERADLVGAIRLGKKAHLRGAGTEVVTDIVVLRKKDGTRPAWAQPWRTAVNQAIGTDENGQPVWAPINEYFVAHPDMVMGKHSATGSMRGANEYTVEGPEGQPLAEAIARAIARLPGNVMVARDKAAPPPAPRQAAANDQPEGELVEQDGAFYTVVNGMLEAPVYTDSKGVDHLLADNARRFERLAPYMAIKNAVRALLDAERSEDATDSQIADRRAELNRVYDHFVKHYGRINDQANGFLRRADPAGHAHVDGLEDVQRVQEVTTIKSGPNKGQAKVVDRLVITKMPIFERRALWPFTAPDKADTPADAAALSMVYRGRLDMEFIAGLLGAPLAEARRLILASGAAFENPESGLLETAAAYLSGPVRAKLAAARTAAASDKRFQVNVTALEAVQPDPVDIQFAGFRLGSTWIPGNVVEDFLRHHFGVEAEVLSVQAGEGTFWRIDVAGGNRDRRNTHEHGATTAVARGMDLGRLAVGETAYVVQGPSHTATGSGREVKKLSSEGGVPMVLLEGFDRPIPAAQVVAARNLVTVVVRPAHKLVADALNLKRPTITYRDDQNNTRKDVEGTEAAREQQKAIQEMFRTWVRSADNPHRQRMTELYNLHANGARLPVWPVPAIQHYPGASPAITLNPNQKVFVSRGLQECFLAAHGVGTGKTFSFITLAMEARRIGTAKKPLIVVHGSTIGQYRKSFATLYPGARVLIPDDKERTRRQRRALLAQIAYGDWDAVVLPHSFFDGIGDSNERMRAYVNEELDNLRDALAEMQRSGQSDWTTKQLEDAIAAKTAALNKMMDRDVDEGFEFEKLGIDALCIDEAHHYKRSMFFTRMGNVKGIDNGFSERSASLILKTRWVREITGGKNVVLATGTPISNTMAEMWTILRYIRPELLAEYHVENFDAWATMFGDTTIAQEETEYGTYKDIERFNRYINGPELLMKWKRATDVQLTKDVAAAGHIKLPAMVTGKPIPVTIARPRALGRFINGLRVIRQQWEDSHGQEKMRTRYIPVVLFGLAKKAAIDLRLVDPELPYDPDGKLAHVVTNVYDIWKRTQDTRLTQVVFLDVYQDFDKKFNAWDEIKSRLMEKGVPDQEVALVPEDEKKKERLFEKVRSGDVRVVIGSTEKLGIGVDMANRMVAAHHVDPPPRPMDLEQRNGRIVRQSNSLNEVFVYYYGVKGSLDSVMFDRLTKKQRFIDQSLIGELEGREFEDPFSEDQMSMSEANAAFAGNPLVFEKVTAETTVKTLRRAKATWERAVSAARARLSDLRAHFIPNAKKVVEQAKQIAAIIDQVLPDGAHVSSFVPRWDIDPATLSKEAAGRWEKEKTIGRTDFPAVLAAAMGPLASGQTMVDTWGETISAEDWAKVKMAGDNRRAVTFIANGLEVKVDVTAEPIGAATGAAQFSFAKDMATLEGTIEIAHVKGAARTLISRRDAGPAAGILKRIDKALDVQRQRYKSEDAQLAEYQGEAQSQEKKAAAVFEHEEKLTKAEGTLARVSAELEALPADIDVADADLTTVRTYLAGIPRRRAARQGRRGGAGQSNFWVWDNGANRYVPVETKLPAAVEPAAFGPWWPHGFVWQDRQNRWHAVEAVTGLAVGHGDDKQEAIDAAIAGIQDQCGSKEIFARLLAFQLALRSDGSKSPWSDHKGVDLPDLSQPPDWAKAGAGRLAGGAVVYHDWKLALVTGADATGKRVYLPGKNGRLFDTDIGDYTGFELTTAEREMLLDAKARHVEAGAAGPVAVEQGPFAAGADVVATAGVDPRLSGLVTELRTMLNLSGRIFLVDPGDMAGPGFVDRYRLRGPWALTTIEAATSRNKFGDGGIGGALTTFGDGSDFT